METKTLMTSLITELKFCLFFGIAILIISMTSGCADTSGNEGGDGKGWVRFSMTEISGNNQEIVGDGSESEPIIVRVELNESPISGITIEWTITEGDGSLSTDSGVTDEDGYAQTTYISGDTTGDMQVTGYADLSASADGPMMGQDLPPVIFTVKVK